MFKKILLITLMVIVFGQSTTAAATTTTTTNNNLTLSSINDVEMLTYFLLWRYGYFNNTFDFNNHHKENNQNQDDDDSLNERKLREFIEKIKINQLIPTTTNNKQSFNNNLKNELNMCSNNSLNKLLGKKYWLSNDNNNDNLKTKLICEVASSCNNAKNLINLIGLQKSMNNEQQQHTPTLSQSIARLCPLMLFQMQEKECFDQQENQFKAKNKPSIGAVWGFGLLFVTIVSFCSIAGVGILPFLSDYSYQIMITILEGLAVGSLVGSALFHLIPQAFNLMIPNGNYEYLWRALIIFGGIYMFFWSERLMKIISELRRRKKSKDFSLPSTTSLENDLMKRQQVHYHNHVYNDDNNCDGNDDNKGQKNKNQQHNHDSSNHNMVHVNNIDHQNNTSSLSMKHDNQQQQHNHNNNHNHLHAHHLHINSNNNNNNNNNETDEIATIAWMIIFGDGLHNFIDGVTMGAAFSQSILEGISISVAVICEEFPHELGDFAILLGSGMSMRKALGYNFLSACTCYLGFVFGILIGDLSDATPFVFALAAGMFLYISLVDMMGELSNKLEQVGKQGGGLANTMQMFLLQNFGIIIGVSIMFILAKYSDRINFEGLVPPKNSDIPFNES